MAKKPIQLPAKTEATFSDGVMTVKGPLGELKKTFKDMIKVEIKNGQITFSMPSNTIRARELCGTYVAHTKNMIAGVNKSYEEKLVIEGIGYKADAKGKDLVLAVGFSHPVSIPIPADIKVVCEKNTVTVTGIDKDKVGQFAAVVRATKKPEPYLGKGIRYAGEVIRRKQGKKTT